MLLQSLYIGYKVQILRIYSSILQPSAPASEWTGGNYFCQKVMARGIAELTFCTAAAAATTRAQPNFGVQN